MTKNEARRETERLERSGWADVQVMVSDGLRRPSYGVSAVDPATGVRTAWHWQAGLIGTDDQQLTADDWAAIAEMEGLA